MADVSKRERAAFPEISSWAWEHPANRSALVTLRTLQGFDAVVKTLSGLLRERQHRLLYLSTAVRVSNRQFAEYDTLLSDCVRIVDATEQLRPVRRSADAHPEGHRRKCGDRGERGRARRRRVRQRHAGSVQQLAQACRRHPRSHRG